MFHNSNLKVEIPSLPNMPIPKPDCAEAVVGRRPRIAIMGEFSAGKSTLTNLLIGSDALPVKVTATHLPPVWLSHGVDKPYGVDLSDQSFDVDFDRIADIPLERTQYLRVQRPASVLELCDIIDFPGISDPNMPAEVWRRVISQADAVIWCSHAVQAWRQSEAAVWDEMPVGLHDKSFLLLTRMDKLVEERDRRRVVARVRRETQGLFSDVFPVSLTRALAAGDDSTAWEASGAEAFMTALLDLITHLSVHLGHEIPTVPAMIPETWDEEPEEISEPAPEPAIAVVGEGEPPVAMAPARPSRVPPADLLETPETTHSAQVRILPRRVSLNGTPRRQPRPTAGPRDLADIFRLS